MKKYIYIFLAFLFLPSLVDAQYYTADFEGLDTNTLPQGWYRKNNLNIVPAYPYANWTARDSGLCIPNITCSAIRHSRCYSGLKSMIVTWGTSIDTGFQAESCDAWMITKKFNNIPSDGYFTFFACGGSPSWTDSMQIWVSTTDSTIPSFTNYLGTIIWAAGPSNLYGVFTMNFFDLSPFAGQNIRIGFRYVSSNSDGYVVMLDYFQMFGTVGINQLGTNVPTKFALQQNYPNPFNPTTKIKFDIAKGTQVKLEVFNNLGQLVQTLFNEFKPAGYYETDFNASKLSSGIYYYRLTTDKFVDMKKMVLIK